LQVSIVTPLDFSGREVSIIGSVGSYPKAGVDRIQKVILYGKPFYAAKPGPRLNQSSSITRWPFVGLKASLE